MEDKHARIMERIRNMLAMSKDTSSPNEAAIAARRVRKLMDEYQVTELDLTTVEGSDMGGTTYATGMKTQSSYNSNLAINVAKYNDCQVKLRSNVVTGFKDLVFEGFLADSVCATEMFRYLRDEGYKQAERYATTRKERHAYRIGFAAGVARQIKDALREREQLKTSTGQALVVCKQQLVSKHFKPPSYRTVQSSYAGSGESYHRGVQAGERASLNRQVRGSQQRALR